jgi:hypothetical protein
MSYQSSDLFISSSFALGSQPTLERWTYSARLPSPR